MDEAFAIETAKVLNAFLAEIKDLRSEVQQLRRRVEVIEGAPSALISRFNNAERAGAIFPAEAQEPSTPAALRDGGVSAEIAQNDRAADTSPGAEAQGG